MSERTIFACNGLLLHVADEPAPSSSRRAAAALGCSGGAPLPKPSIPRRTPSVFKRPASPHRLDVPGQRGFMNPYPQPGRRHATRGGARSTNSVKSGCSRALAVTLRPIATRDRRARIRALAQRVVEHPPCHTRAHQSGGFAASTARASGTSPGPCPPVQQARQRGDAARRELDLRGEGQGERALFAAVRSRAS